MRRLPIVLLLLLVMSAYADVSVVETVDTPAVAPLVGDALVAMAQRLQNIANESVESNQALLQENVSAEPAIIEPVNESVPAIEISTELNAQNESSVQEQIVQTDHVPTSQADESLSGDVVLGAQENASGDTPASVVIPLEEVYVPVEQTSVEVIETVDSPAQAPLVEEALDDLSQSLRSAVPAGEEVNVSVEPPIAQDAPVAVEVPLEVPQVIEENLSDEPVVNESLVNESSEVVVVNESGEVIFEPQSVSVEVDDVPVEVVVSNATNVSKAANISEIVQPQDVGILRIVDASKLSVAARIQVKAGSGSVLFDSRSRSVQSVQLPDRADVDVEFDKGTIKSIAFEGVALNESPLLNVDDLPESMSNARKWNELYA